MKLLERFNTCLIVSVIAVLLDEEVVSGQYSMASRTTNNATKQWTSLFRNSSPEELVTERIYANTDKQKE